MANTRPKSWWEATYTLVGCAVVGIVFIVGDVMNIRQGSFRWGRGANGIEVDANRSPWFFWTVEVVTFAVAITVITLATRNFLWYRKHSKEGNKDAK